MEQKAWNAKRVGMVLLALVMAASALLFATGCSSQSNQNESIDPITMVWLPDNSSADLTQSREAIGDVIKEATGRDVELMTTTDYNVAIEAISSGSAQMALLGAEGYVQANSKNDAVQAAFTTAMKTERSTALATTAAFASPLTRPTTTRTATAIPWTA